MRRMWIMLLVVAVALVLTLPARAVKPNCETNPSHPSCQPADEPVSGGTCDTGDTLAAELKTDDFAIELGGKKTHLPDSACVDVMTTAESRWVVTISGAGGRHLTLVPRDSVGPGDSCGGFSARGEEHIYGQWTLPLVQDPRFDAISAATVNACRGNADPNGPTPDGEFTEWIETYPGTEDPALWDAEAICAAADLEAPCEVETALPQYPHPLILQAFFTGAGNSTVKICIDLPPLEPELEEGLRGIPEVCRPSA